MYLHYQNSWDLLSICSIIWASALNICKNMLHIWCTSCTIYMVLRINELNWKLHSNLHSFCLKSALTDFERRKLKTGHPNYLNLKYKVTDMNKIFHKRYLEIYVFVIFLLGITLKVFNSNVYCHCCKIAAKFKI